MKSMLTLAFILLSGGCATITSGTFQTLLVETPEVVAAQCTLTDSKDKRWHVGSTPGTVTVLKGDGPLHVLCEKEGYKPGSLSVEETVAGATFGNLILGGGIGIFVDIVSGAAQRYPDKVMVWMEPAAFASAEEESRWRAARAAQEQAAAADSASTEVRPAGASD